MSWESICIHVRLLLSSKDDRISKELVREVSPVLWDGLYVCIR